MAKNKERKRETRKKKTSIGNSKLTKEDHPVPLGATKDIKKDIEDKEKANDFTIPYDTRERIPSRTI